MTNSQTAIPTSPTSGLHASATQPQRVDSDPIYANPQAEAVLQLPDATANGLAGGPAEAAAALNQPQAEIPAAIRVITALQLVAREFKPIGDCPTIFGAEVKRMKSYGADAAEVDPEDIEGDYEERRNNYDTEDVARVQRNEERFGQLAEIAEGVAKNLAEGFLDDPFSLRITRPGCEYDGLIARNSVEEGYVYTWLVNSDEVHAIEAARKALLRQWYKHASVSGYGDVETQTTKIDKDVRAAREIPASEFSVDDELLRRIEGIWMKHFVPARWGVRAEPYKIHLYGPDDHFKPHRDTPQNDLVGTFLVGLGQSSKEGGLVVDGKKVNAYPASWCAFYPDVPHRVATVWRGYRAVIAFKLFRVEVARAALETEQTAEIRAKVAQLIGEVEAPYGVLLSHKYTLMTRHFNGFDAILADAIQAEAHRLGLISLHRLPVVVTTDSSWGTRSDHPDEYYEIYCRTKVHALTSGHIDMLAALGEDAYDRKFTHTACGCPWLEGVKSVPFYTVDLSDSTLFRYKDSEEETCNYVGNEAQAWRADSVYLSFALLVLSKPSECVDRQETGLEVSTGAEGNEDTDSEASA